MFRPRHPVAAWSIPNRILSQAIVAELLYIAAVRLLRIYHTGGVIENELCWTVLRLVSLLVLWRLFHSLGRRPDEPKQNHLKVGGIASLSLIVPVLLGNMGVSATTAHVFALTSLAVGFREEIFYRGLLQNSLKAKWGVPAGLLLSNIAFLLYHYGVQPFTIANISMMFFAGIVLGLAYELTGSLVLAGLLHAAYDMVWCYSPYLEEPLPSCLGGLILCAVSLILFLNLPSKRTRRLATR